MKDLLFVAGFLAFWITLNRWILPWFGIETCMSGGCCSHSASRHCPVDDPALQSETGVNSTGTSTNKDEEPVSRSSQLINLSRTGR